LAYGRMRWNIVVTDAIYETLSLVFDILHQSPQCSTSFSHMPTRCYPTSTRCSTSFSHTSTQCYHTLTRCSTSFCHISTRRSTSFSHQSTRYSPIRQHDATIHRCFNRIRQPSNFTAYFPNQSSLTLNFF